ncbi:putative phiE125 gp8 family phage protein [Novosphingobium sp. PhB55]|uniref:head-tail connector protein n=1 Tax=Novosphingobium sp. PhB55 TaxID=2485106 RepID=UPI001065F354|nr:head-tail connector protein [Novosphingobium sp. PhB55]TDW65355.1 putative phiE125 gp8 family phage protein [Novosphingobium sp. PhB55]
MSAFVLTPPEPVVSVPDAKAHLRVLHADEDALIATYIAAATAHIDGPDGWLGRAIGIQTLEMRLPTFGNCGAITLPYPPAVDIESVAYVNALGDSVELASDQYELSGGVLRPAWPTSFPVAAWRGAAGETVRIRWKAGYADLPPAIQAAILLMVGDLYANRETAAVGSGSAPIPMSTTVETLLSPLRVFT